MSAEYLQSNCIMEVVNASYLPGDPMLVERIVYELKAQGIFDQFRKECIADVDTKPAYQNLRQRVEGSVTGFLKKQKWKPEMNKNQVREMLRKSIYESGFLETGVDRIVNQVVNPKIEKVFQPKVAEVVYKYLGIEKPMKEEDCEKKDLPVDVENLLPTDLEAVSPDSETIDKKLDKSFESQNLHDSKNDDDESPPFEPLEEQPSSYLPVEENSIDSHMSGFSGLISHDSNSNEAMKAMEPDIYNQDSQISKQSLEDNMILSTAEESETKLEGGDDSHASKSSKSQDSPMKNNDMSPDVNDKGSNSSNSKSSTKKDKPKPEDKKTDKKSDSHKHRSRNDSKSDNKNDKDKRNDKRDTKDRHKGSRDSSKDNKERRDSKSSHNHRERERKSSSSKHSNSSSRDHSVKKDSSAKDEKKVSSSKDTKRDSKGSSKSDKHRRDEKNHKSHSSSNKRERESGNNKKDSRKESKDDHFSSKLKKSDRRSTDRDSNDGQSGNSGTSSAPTDSSNSQQSNKTKENTSSNSGSGSNDSGASDNVEIMMLRNNIADDNRSIIKIIKPKFASNIHEARKLMKIRKHLHKLEQEMFENTIIATTEKMNSTNDVIASDHKEIKKNYLSPQEFNNSVSAASWDEIEAKLNSQIYSTIRPYNEYTDYNTNDVDGNCLYLPNDIPEEMLKCKMSITRFMDSYNEDLRKSDKITALDKDNKGIKRKMHNLENDVQNNNKKYNNNSIESHEQFFSLPLSPAESESSIDKKLYPLDITEKQRKAQIKAKATQRYSSDDLYKPRLFNGSRRRTGKPNILE